MTDLVLRSVEVDGRLTDVHVRDETVVSVAPQGDGPRGAETIDGRGHALIPGLHDHHLHLLATAAAQSSVQAGPPAVSTRDDLAAAFARADDTLATGQWLRAVGYHESVAGDLDRDALDALLAHRPVRVQHRSGARWVLNTTAIELLDLDHRRHEAIERDPTGRATGRLNRGDTFLRTLLPDDAAPDLEPLGLALARSGVTGVTDTTPYGDRHDLDAIAVAVATGALPQQVVVTGSAALAGAAAPDGLRWGPVKIVIDDAQYPSLDELADQVGAAHAAGRPVAVHCVTRAALALAIAMWDDAGAMTGDRVEHGSVVPPDLRDGLVRLGLTVVTQPAFVCERGDDYLAEVDADDLPHLYPCRSLLDAGIPVAGSTDAPYAPADPWLAVRAAVARRTRAGRELGVGEAVSPARALFMFLGRPDDPGGPARRIEPGAPADLCLLDAPLADVLAEPAAERVVATWCRGRRVV